MAASGAVRRTLLRFATMTPPTCPPLRNNWAWLHGGCFGAQRGLYSTMAAQKPSPLDGIKILDFTRIIAGPFATMLLADLGAEVWKVEKLKTGDDARNFLPPEVDGESCYFMSFNRNKKSIAIDMKTKEGIEICKELAKKADVLVENFMPTAMPKLGLGYEQLKQLNPRLIFCSISGYGPTGPWSDRGGFDVIAAAIGGLLGVTGPEGGEPVKPGIAVCDLMTAQYAHGAIMAALLHRHKTGLGQKIDCNLLDTQISTLTNIGNGYLNTGNEPIKRGTDHESVVPYRGFRTKDDRWMIIGAGNQKMFAEFCEVIGMPELLQVAEYKTNRDRVINRKKLCAILQDRFLEKTLEEWTAVFWPTKMPFGPVNNMQEAFSNPQVIHNQLVQEVDHPRIGKVRLTGPAVKYSESNNSVRSSPPMLGQHTVDILTNVLGMGDEQIERLRKDAIVEYPDKREE